MPLSSQSFLLIGLFAILPAINSLKKYEAVEKGQLYTPNYRVFIKKTDDDKFISPWHDIPFYADEKNNVFNMVVEIPRWTQAKMEMSTKEQMSPIRQDIVKGTEGEMRFVRNIYPFKGYIWNYGALPQTWEDPQKENKHTKAIGDNDPIDVVEIGSKIHPTGSVIHVKILGILGMLDDDETDWKLVAIDVTDKLAKKLNNIEDVEEEMPGYLDDTRKWFRNYKRPEGKGPNKFAFNGEFQGRKFAHEIIEETNNFWKELIKSKNAPKNINTECYIDEGVNKALDDVWQNKVEKWAQFENAKMSPEIMDWYFLKEKKKNTERNGRKRLRTL